MVVVDGPGRAAEGGLLGTDLRACPDCGSSSLVVVAEWYRADVMCEGCGAHWRVQHGWLFRVVDRAPT